MHVLMRSSPNSRSLMRETGCLKRIGLGLEAAASKPRLEKAAGPREAAATAVQSVPAPGPLTAALAPRRHGVLGPGARTELTAGLELGPGGDTWRAPFSEEPLPRAPSTTMGV